MKLKIIKVRQDFNAGFKCDLWLDGMSVEDVWFCSKGLRILLGRAREGEFTLYPFETKLTWMCEDISNPKYVGLFTIDTKETWFHIVSRGGRFVAGNQMDFCLKMKNLLGERCFSFQIYKGEGNE